MWYEFPIPANSEKQRVIIRQLRKWINSLESREIIQGFAFDHYSPVPLALHIRFDCDDDKLKTVKKELEQEVKKLLPDYVPEERLWDGGKNFEYVYKAYEFGSRCAFLAWELIDIKRFPESFFTNFYKGRDDKGVHIFDKEPFEFQRHFNHGVMNSLGISKAPNELFVHLLNLMDATKSRNKQELIAWLQKNHALIMATEEPH